MRTLFDCHPEGGVATLALSKDSKHLVTVGAGAVQVRYSVMGHDRWPLNTRSISLSRFFILSAASLRLGLDQ